MKPHVILKNKLIPPDCSQMVLRRRLLEKAASSEEHLVILCADAGYGKTTAMAQLSAAHQGKSIWYLLGPEDQDLSVFLTHFSEGMKNVIPGFGAQIDRVLKNKADLAADQENIMMVLVSEMLEFTKEPLAICLDEFRHINGSRSTLAAVQFLVKHLPADFRIMITSRTKPKLQLGRLRSQRQLLEFGADDLRFDSEEAAELFSDCCSRGLTKEELEEWVKATDGWPIALYLSNNLLKTTRRQPREVLDELLEETGSIATYLAEELFSGLSSDLQDFMMCCSLSDVIDVSVCDKVLGGGREVDYSVKYIRELEDQNLMVHRIKSGKKYQFQKMARQFLRRKLSENKSPQELAELNLRYGEAYEQSGDYDNAIKHYEYLGDVQAVARVIRDHGVTIMEAGRYEAITGWLSKIPGSEVDKQPMLTYIAAQTFKHLGEMEIAESQLALAEKAFTESGDQYGAFLCVASLAELYFMQEKYRKSRETWTRALALAEKPLDRIATFTNIMESNLLLGDTRGAYQILQQAIEEKDDTTLEFGNMTVVGKMVVDSMMGDFRASMAGVLEIELQYNPQAPSETYFRVMYFRIINLREASRYLEALAVLEEATAVLDNKYKLHQLILDFNKAIILLCMGHGDAGNELLKKTLKKITRIKAYGPYFSPLPLGDYYRWYGMPDKAIKLLVPRLQHDREKEKEHSVAKLLVNLGANKLRRFDCAEDYGMAELEEAEKIATEQNYRFVLTQVHFQQAWRALRRGDEAKALDRITKALDMAERYKHTNFIVQEGKISLELLVFAFEAGVHRDYLTMIFGLIGPLALTVLPSLTRNSSVTVRMAVIPAMVAAGGFRAAPHVRRLIRDQDATVRRAANAELAILRTSIEEPGKILTARENQVFEMMARGHSNAEISQELFISEPTVKSHITKIFQKLGMTRRSQAALYVHRDRKTGSEAGED